MENQDNPENLINGKYEDGRALAEEITRNLYTTRRALSDLNPGNVPGNPSPSQPPKRYRQEPDGTDPRAAPDEHTPYPKESSRFREPAMQERQPPAEDPHDGSSRTDADLKWLDDPQTLYLRKKLHVPDALSFVGNLAQVLSSSCVTEAMKKVKLMADLIASTDQVPYPVFAIDPDGKVIAWNKEMERVTEVPAHDMIGRGDHAYAVPFYGKARPMLVDFLILPHPGPDSGTPRDVLSSKPETVRILGRLQLMWGRGTRIYDEAGTIVAAVQSIGIHDPVPPAKQPDREKAVPGILPDYGYEPEPAPLPRQRVPFPQETPEPARSIARQPPGKAADPAPGVPAARKRTEDLRNTLGQLVVKEEELLRNIDALSQDRQNARERPEDPGQRGVKDDILRNIEALSQDRPLRERGTAGRLVVKEEVLPRNSEAVPREMRQITPREPDRTEALYEQVVVNAREGIVAFDTGMKCLLWNPFMEQLTGVPEDEVLGRRAFDMFPALREAGAHLLLEQALAGKTAESSDISCHIPISGKQVWVRLIVSALRDSNQDIIGTIGIIQDTTARKVMEYTLQTTIMQLMESEEKYRSVFNAKNDPLILIDTASRRIMDLNAAILDLYGYQREEFFRLSPADLFTEPEKYNEILDQKSAGLCLCRQRKRDGVIFPADVSHASFELKGRRVLILSIRDLSSAYQTADALRLANTKLNLLIGVTRHDVLNNLTVLMGYNDLLKHTVRDGKVLEMLEKEEIALKAVQRQIDFTREYYNLGVKSPLWQNICEISTRAYSQFITTVAFTCDTHDLEVYADPLLEKVFYNLFDNAIRHGERITHVRIYSAREGSELVLIFGDDGRGIRPENKERIFKRGFGKHTGLGLFLTREILAITRIDIAETGEFEKGARFELRIPAGMYRFPESDNPIKVSGSETMNLHAW